MSATELNQIIGSRANKLCLSMQLDGHANIKEVLRLLEDQ